MVAYAQAAAPNETGGVLLGRHDPDTGACVVVEAVGPGADANHQDTTFEPDQHHHETIIAQRYVESGGQTTYLGDWHSHPGGTTHLSFRDRRVLHLVATYEEARCPTPVMAIVAGTPQEGWRVGLWTYEPYVLGPWKLPVGRTRPLKITQTG